MRAMYVPDPAATVALERLAVAAPGTPGAAGELTVTLKDRRQVRAVLPAGQLRDLVRRWAAAARAGLDELVVGE